MHLPMATRAQPSPRPQVGGGGARAGLRLVAIALALAGLGFIAEGAWLKLKAATAQVLLERSFDRAGNGGVAPPPWPWADIRPLARLSAPRIGARAIVLDDANAEALAFGPAHVSGTPMPGEAGASVIAAHRDTHFSWIGRLVPGDRVSVARLDGSSADFTVRRAWVARFDDNGIDAAGDGTRLMLATCWPLDGSVRGPYRYIVEAVATGR